MLGVPALYPRLVGPEPPHNVIQPLLPALRLLSLLQVRAARQEALRAAAVARAQALIGLDHVRPGPGKAGVGGVGVSEELLAAVVLQLPLLLRLLDDGVAVLGPGQSWVLKSC